MNQRGETATQNWSNLVNAFVFMGAAKVFGKLKSFNRKPQACALGMDGSLSAVNANTHACGLRLNDLSAHQGKLPHPSS